MSLTSRPVPGIFRGKAALCAHANAPSLLAARLAWLQSMRTSEIVVTPDEGTPARTCAQTGARVAHDASAIVLASFRTTDADDAMTTERTDTGAKGFDFGAPAELFTVSTRRSKSAARYRRFETAAEAIRFAIEELPPPILLGTYLEVREDRFDGPAIRLLYDRPDYPLRRITDASDD